MSESPKRPTGAAVAAALSPFVGLPLTFAVLTAVVGVEVSDEFGGPLSRIQQTWVEGGWGMYLVLAAGGVLSTVAAVLMFFGVQRGSPGVLANAPLASLLVAVGVFGFWDGMVGSFRAVAHAAVEDQAIIMAAATGEAFSTTLLGCCAMAGLLVSLCFGTLLGVLSQEGLARRLLIASTAIFASLAALAGASAVRLHELSGGFKAIAHASPVDRLSILVGTGNDLARLRVPFLAVVAVFVVVLIAAPLLLKEAPRLVVLAPLMALAGLFGFGAHEFALKRVEGDVAAMGRDVRLGLIELAGFPTESPDLCVKSNDVVECVERQPFEDLLDEDGEFTKKPPDVPRKPGKPMADERLRELLMERKARFSGSLYGGETSIAETSIGLMSGAEASGTWKVLRLAANGGFRRMALIGETTPRVPEVPSEYKAIVAALSLPFRMAPVGLEPVSGCAKCKRATVSGDGLVVGAETWKAGSLDEVFPDRLEDEVAITAETSMRAETLVKLALAAAAHRHRLVLLFPDDEFRREQGEEPTSEVEGTGKGIDSLMAGMFGGEDVAKPEAVGLEKEQLASVVKKHTNEMRHCYEQALVRKPTLAGKVVLRWVVKPDGSVAEVEVTENTLKDAGAVECLRSRPPKWRFPKPANGEDVVVSYPFVFQAAE
jgi:hypothetical protein